MSESVPTSPSPLKSAFPVHGAAGQLPARQAKKDSMSESVPTSPSQLKSAEPHREVCDSMAALLGVVPQVLLASARYEPQSAVVTPVIVSAGPVAPLIRPVFASS